MKYLMIILGASIILACVEVMRLMPKSDRNVLYGLLSLRVIKYVLAASSGFLLAYYALKGYFNVWHAFGGVTILLFPVAEIFNRYMYDLSINKPEVYNKLNSLLQLTHRRATDANG